jgi:uncharacterized protein (DUF488 family)
MTIYTIGYEGIDINGFLSLLRRHKIETVVDVRELPLSRRRQLEAIQGRISEVSR